MITERHLDLQFNLSKTLHAKSDTAWLVAEGKNVYVSWWETIQGEKKTRTP